MSPLFYMEPGDRRKLFRKLAPTCHFSAQELAEYCQVGRRQLEHYFDHDLGKPPQEWLEIRRMLAAAYLLLKTDSIKDVYKTLGFFHASAFCHEFRRYFGMSPTEFLRQKPLFCLECAQDKLIHIAFQDN